MLRINRRRANAALLALGALGPFGLRAQQPGPTSKLLGSAGARLFDAFEWLPTECADERYPMQLVSGWFNRGADRIVPVPVGKIVNNGWGSIGSIHLVGDSNKPVPERLTLAWFSYAEDQFFAGTIDLPQTELAKLFRAGFDEPETGKRVTWSRIIVGMGLGGWCSVWLAGGTIVREVARAQLEAKTLDWRRVVDNPAIPRADFVRSKLLSRLGEDALAQLEKHGPPVSTWPRYAQRHRWQIIVEGMHEHSSILMRKFNGERSFHDLAGPQPPGLASAPKHLLIRSRNRNGRKLLTTIQLNEQEVFDALDRAISTDMAPLTMRVVFAPRNQVTVSLERGAERTPLPRSSFKMESLV